jgi:P27 family predicted phage terminase small subunit
MKHAKTAHQLGLEGRTAGDQAPDGDMPAPEYMTREQKDLWDEQVANAPPGLLRNVDTSILEAWVIAKDTFRRAAQESATSTITAETHNGYPMLNPCHIAMKQQAELMMKAARLLGFTPTSRATIKLPKAAASQPSGSSPTNSGDASPSDSEGSRSGRRTLWGAQGPLPSSSNH